MWTEGQTEGQTDEQTDEQTDVLLCKTCFKKYFFKVGGI